MKSVIALAALTAFVSATSSASAVHAGDDVVPVAIYRGPAACDDCPEALARAITRVSPRYRVTFVGPNERQDITDASLRHFKIYVQPGGGQDIAAALTQLGPQRVQAIRRFVTDGGNYLGLCMGAYLADRSNIGLIDDQLDSEVRRPGSSATDEDDTAVPVRWGGQVETLYYQDGPFFPAHADGRSFRQLAAYRNGDVAAAHYRAGSGSVVLSGPHPEADASWFADADLPRTMMPAGAPIKTLLDQFAL